MLLLQWISLLIIAAVAYAESREQPTELIIDSTYSPPECTVKAGKGDSIEVHYTGKLWSNDNKFDSSLDRGQPLPLTLGAGQVIRGWDEGLLGMCLNEKRTLTIPSDMAYGSRGIGSIPPNSALVFDVELVGLSPSKRHEEL